MSTELKGNKDSWKSSNVEMGNVMKQITRFVENYPISRQWEDTLIHKDEICVSPNQFISSLFIDIFIFQYLSEITSFRLICNGNLELLRQLPLDSISHKSSIVRLAKWCIQNGGWEYQGESDLFLPIHDKSSEDLISYTTWFCSQKKKKYYKQHTKQSFHGSNVIHLTNAGRHQGCTKSGSSICFFCYLIRWSNKQVILKVLNKKMCFN